MMAKQFKPKIDREKLALMLGARKKAALSKALSLKIRQLTEKFSGLLTPRIQYDVEPVLAVTRGGVRISEAIELKSAKLAKVLAPCHELIAFIATVGEGLDEETSALMRHNHYSTAYILDTMGSLAVESIVQQFQAQMREQVLNRGLDVSLRFSPGYCDWPITEQRKLFHLFPHNRSGVKLTETCLMQPRKSISGVFGIFSLAAGSLEPPYNPCQECSRTECLARRA